MSSELIGVVLRSPEQRHVQEIKYCMAHLMGRCLEELSDHSVHRRYSLWRRFLRRGLMQIAQIFIAKSDRRPLVPCVGNSTFPSPHCQIYGQSQRTEDLLDLL